MGKSIRSKVKRHFRAKKRESGTYAAAEAARLERLSAKLTLLRDTEKSGEVSMSDVQTNEAAIEKTDDSTSEVLISNDALLEDTVSNAKATSTHGPRNSRRDEWRASKGMTPRPKSSHVNRQGLVAARRKAGRPKRRR